MVNLGFLAALGAALAWGTYMVPFKKAGSDKLVLFQAVMSVGILISGFIFSIILNYSLNLNIYGIFAGVLWAIANVIALTAIFNLGISKAVPLMSSLVIGTSFLWGLVFGELSSGMVMGLGGIGLIILGVVLVSSSGKTAGQNMRKGLQAAVLAGLIWGSQFAPIKMGNVLPKEYFFSMSFGIFAAAVVIAAVKKTRLENQAITESLFSGTLWNIGNLLGVIAISLVGLAKGLPITQVAVLVAVIWGLFYFKEITGTRDRLQILIGAAILLIGVIALGLA